MGIHMTLQGIRGVTVPALGVWLYTDVGLDIKLIGIAAVVQLVASAGFLLVRSPETGNAAQDIQAVGKQEPRV